MTRDEAMALWTKADRAGEDAYVEAIQAGAVTADDAHKTGSLAAATVIQQAFAEREERLADHVAVHRAMLQGHIAKPSPANIWHLYQRDLLDAMPDEFKDVRYSRADVDAYIDEARQALAAKGDSRG